MDILEKPRQINKGLITIDMINKENFNPNSSRMLFKSISRTKETDNSKKTKAKVVTDLSFFNITHKSNKELNRPVNVEKDVPQLACVSKLSKKSTKTHIMLKNIIKRDSMIFGNKNGCTSHRTIVNQSFAKPNSTRLDVCKKNADIRISKLGSALDKKKSRQFNLDTIKKTFLNTNDNPQNCLTYLPNIVLHMFSKETTQAKFKGDCFKLQTEVNPKMRYLLYDWLISVAVDFKLHDRTLALAVDLIELYMLSYNVPKDLYQLIGISALFASSKYEEIYPPTLSDFSTACNNYYSHKQIVEVETQILHLISFDMSRVVALDYYEIFSNSMELTKQAHCYGLYILNLSLLEHSLISTNRAVLAFAVCYLVAKMFKISWKGKVFDHANKRFLQFSLFSGNFTTKISDLPSDVSQECALPEEDVKLTAVKLYKLIKVALDRKESAVFKKFSKDEFLKIALLQLN